MNQLNYDEIQKIKKDESIIQSESLESSLNDLNYRLSSLVNYDISSLETMAEIVKDIIELFGGVGKKTYDTIIEFTVTPETKADLKNILFFIQTPMQLNGKREEIIWK